MKMSGDTSMEKPVPKYKPGDVVKLRSSERAMTVEFVLNYDRKVHPGIGYLCCWMSGRGKMYREEIAEPALTLVKSWSEIE